MRPEQRFVGQNRLVRPEFRHMFLDEAVQSLILRKSTVICPEI